MCNTTQFIVEYQVYYQKSCSLGQAKPEPSWQWGLWPGLHFHQARAPLSQAKYSSARVHALFCLHLEVTMCADAVVGEWLHLYMHLHNKLVPQIQK